MKIINGISNIERQFKSGKSNIAYLTSGDDSIARTFDAACALIDGGATMLEIGVPFSDPIADGPVIARASARAVSANVTFADIFKLTHTIKHKYPDIPLILFSYFNPILSHYHANFIDDIKSAGIDGLLLIDCPLEESKSIYNECIAAEIAAIYVIAESTPLERIIQINKVARGFIYYACQRGTTGVRHALPDNLVAQINLIKSHIDLPLVVGFGISNASQVKHILQHADGVVVGSLFVKALEDGISMLELSLLAKTLFQHDG